MLAVPVGRSEKVWYSWLVEETLNLEPAGGGRPEPEGGAPSTAGRGVGLGLVVGALGVVFGDIGTSPLYSIQTVFSIDNGAVKPTAGDVYGIVSLVFWSITLIVSIKYVLFVMRADNDGEGGVMALAALARGALRNPNGRRVAVVLALGVLGASLFYGDSVITPAISVLSAVEGLKVAAPGLAKLVVPIAAVILTLLFALQRWGTQRVGNLFGPVMVIWFGCLAVVGVAQVVRRPAIVRGLSPSYAAQFVVAHPYVAFIAMGAVVLAITGGEALYADMGHFGRPPIRLAWFGLVFPALTLNYLAQAALILRDPASRANPFFLLVPHWARLPMVVLATAATVIASQAVISGAFSVSRQALRLGFLPHLRVRQTSAKEYGQIYVAGVNWGLFAAVALAVITFRSSARLATAYGVAVTGTFLLTTSLFLVVARARWHWATWRLVLAAVVFGGTELTFFSANLTKVTHGGWLTLLIALIVFTVMMTWQRGRQIVTARRVEMEGPLADFLDAIHTNRTSVQRVPGTAVFAHPTKETTPLALRANATYNHVLHEHIVIISGSTANIPHIPWDQRLTIDHLGNESDGIVHVDAQFGFQDTTDFPEVLRRIAEEHPDFGLDPDNASYFVSRITLRRSNRPDMVTWRKTLFIALAHNAPSQAEFLCLPNERTIVLSGDVPI